MADKLSPVVNIPWMTDVKKHICHEDESVSRGGEFCYSDPSKWKKSKGDKVKLSDIPGEEGMCRNFIDWYSERDCGRTADKIENRLEEIIEEIPECEDLSAESQKRLMQEIVRGQRTRDKKKVPVEMPVEQPREGSVKRAEGTCRAAIEKDLRINELTKIITDQCNGFNGADLARVGEYCKEKVGGTNWWTVGGISLGIGGGIALLRKMGRTAREAGEALDDAAKGLGILRRGVKAIGKEIGNAGRDIKNGVVRVGKGIAGVWKKAKAGGGKKSGVATDAEGAGQAARSTPRRRGRSSSTLPDSSAAEPAVAASGGAAEPSPFRTVALRSAGGAAPPSPAGSRAPTPADGVKSPLPGMPPPRPPTPRPTRQSGPVLTPAPQSMGADQVSAVIGQNSPRPDSVLAQLKTYVADPTNFDDGMGEKYRRLFNAIGLRGQVYLSWWAIYHWNQIPVADRDLALENAQNRGFGELPKPFLTREFIPDTLTAERMMRIGAQANAFNEEVLKPRGLNVGIFRIAASRGRQGIVNFGAGAIPFAAAKFFSDFVWDKPHQNFTEFALNYGALTAGGSSAKMLMEGAFNLKDGLPFLSDVPFAGEVSSNLARRLATRSVSTFAAFAMAEWVTTGKVDPKELMETFVKATTVSTITGGTTSLALNGSKTTERFATVLKLAKRVKQASGGAKVAGAIGAAALAPEVVPTALGAAALLAADFVIIDGITVKVAEWRMKKAENEIGEYMQDELIDAVMANNALISERKKGGDVPLGELMEASQKLERARAAYEGYIISRSGQLKNEWREKRRRMEREETEARIEAAADGNRAMGQVRDRYASMRAKLDEEYKEKIAELEGNGTRRALHALPLSNESPTLSYFQELKIFYTPEDRLNTDHQMRRTALRNNAREPFRKALASNIYSVLDQMDDYTQTCNKFWEGEIKKVYLASR